MKSYKQIISTLIKKNISISIVESCTGGLLSAEFTKVSGVSKIFNMGIVAYSNEAKSKMLKIPKTYFKTNSAVSSKTAILMVKKINKISNSKLTISITGIAGPNGGSKKKPVGLVYMGLLYKNKLICMNKIFKGSRKEIQKKTVKHIFNTIEKLI